MSFGDYIYILCVVFFVFITFGIIKNYYKNKFDENEERIDMKDDKWGVYIWITVENEVKFTLSQELWNE